MQIRIYALYKKINATESEFGDFLFTRTRRLSAALLSDFRNSFLDEERESVTILKRI